MDLAQRQEATGIRGLERLIRITMFKPNNIIALIIALHVLILIILSWLLIRLMRNVMSSSTIPTSSEKTDITYSSVSTQPPPPPPPVGGRVNNPPKRSGTGGAVNVASVRPGGRVNVGTNPGGRVNVAEGTGGRVNVTKVTSKVVKKTTVGGRVNVA